MDLALIISIISVAIAAVTLFLTDLRPAQITLHLGPGLKIYYTELGGVSFYLPITFINVSPRTGIVYRATMTLFKQDMPDTRYLFQWRSFSKFDSATGVWVYDEIAHALAVPGKSAVAKVVWFSWPEDLDDKPTICDGKYVVVLHIWFGSDGPIFSEAHELMISLEDVARLNSYKENQKLTAIDLALDAKTVEHRVVNEQEWIAILSP